MFNLACNSTGKKILEIMKTKLILIGALFFAGLSFSSNIDDSQLNNKDEVFASCYAMITTSEYNYATGGYITTTSTYYLGEVDYGSYGANAAACEGRVNRFSEILYSN